MSWHSLFSFWFRKEERKPKEKPLDRRKVSADEAHEIFVLVHDLTGFLEFEEGEIVKKIKSEKAVAAIQKVRQKIRVYTRETLEKLEKHEAEALVGILQELKSKINLLGSSFVTVKDKGPDLKVERMEVPKVGAKELKKLRNQSRHLRTIKGRIAVLEEEVVAFEDFHRNTFSKYLQ